MPTPIVQLKDLGIFSRPDNIDYHLAYAFLVASRGTCRRRKVGCVLVNSRFELLSTGRNGPPRGEPHCTEHPCPGANCPSGQGLDLCEAVHAEANALLQCRDVQQIYAVFCTTAPCIHCVKLLMNTSAMRIYFVEDYPHSQTSHDLWTRSGGRVWQHVALEAAHGLVTANASCID